MNKVLMTGILAVSVGVLGGCNDDDDKSRPAPAQPSGDGVAKLRVIHAVADAPNVNVLANGDALLSNVPYAAASAVLGVPPATYDVQVDGILPAGTATVIGPAEIPLSDDDITNVLAVNTLADIEPLIVTVPDVAVADDSVRLTVVHGAAAAPRVDVHVTAPNAALGEPVGSFEFKGTLGPVTVPAGEYRIRVTLAGTDTVVFDTGATGVGLSGGADLLVTAIANTDTGESPINLLVAGSDGASVLRDASTRSAIKVVHSAPSVGDAEVFVSSASLGLTDVELIDTLEYNAVFPSANGTVSVDPANDYQVKVSQAGTGAGAALIDVENITLTAGQAYTVVATGGSNGEDAQLLLTADDNRAIATEARVKVMHAAPAAGVVDVYVTPAGSVSDADVLNGDVTPTLNDFAFAAITPYVSLAAGDYDVRVVTVVGNILAVDETLALPNGLVANVIAYGPDEVDNDPSGFGLRITSNQ